MVNKLERIPQVYLCLRGDSKKNLINHDKFFNEMLDKVFIVGAKSVSHYKESTDSTYSHYERRSHNLKNDIKELIKQVNVEILEKPESHQISGQISPEFQADLMQKDVDSLGKWKSFFLAFLHNSGSHDPFKKQSPFLSVTYGYKKISTAKKFALSRNSYNRGILYLYSLNSGWPYYIRSHDFMRELKRYGVTWYKDNHREIMLLDGMYPHFLLGIFEVSPRKSKKFVVNPWLNKLLSERKPFDYVNGLEIDQVNFYDMAKKLGYVRYNFHYIYENESYVSELNENVRNKIFRP